MIRAMNEHDRNKMVRKWFMGDADAQRAFSERKEGESVFPVEIYTKGLRSVKIEFGWAVGKEAK